MIIITPVYILIVVFTGVALLLLMVLKFRLSAFLALLVTSVLVGILAGMPLSDITASIEKGMGSTLGFIATIVGLGAIFGQLLERSGGAGSMARYLLMKFGAKRAPWALTITGFLIGIPIFLDVGFIIIIPVIYALARDSGKSLLYYAIPLLAGLAVTHAMVPPTPGPTAVAQILGVDLGWVIFFGVITGIPVVILAGPVFGRFISNRIFVKPPDEIAEERPQYSDPVTEVRQLTFGIVAMLIAIPLVLIIISTFVNFGIESKILAKSLATDLVVFLGHPFTALIIATLLTIIICLRKGFSRNDILTISTRALGPAGIIILVTGAGGVLKQILVDSGIGQVLAESIAGSSVPLIFLAWLLAAVVRITQGSATVAMITAAGIMSPILESLNMSQPESALIVISIASGATILSHVNDSGFWIVSKYLGINEKSTLKSWTVMETIISVSGLILSSLISILI